MFSIKHLTKATPAKWVKVGLALTAVSAAVNGYGLTQGLTWVSMSGLGCLVVGTFIVNMFGEPIQQKEGEV